MLQKGTKLNGVYTLLEEIGSGGGGIVYKAYHENLKKYVVVKQIKDVAKDVLDTRAEADILKNLRNSYLPQVYDFIQSEGEIYTVIDFIEGESLDKTLRREGRIGQKEVLKWARQLADALAYLHSQNPPIIHSDIKPANIMLTPKRDICLIDFNVSLAFDEEKRTSAGISEGYSPPEQYRNYSMYCSMSGTQNLNYQNGERRTELVSEISAGPQTESEGTRRITEALVGRGVDERSDIFSLGATLYHLLTGVCPSERFEEIVPLHNYKGVASEGFSVIIEKMMELQPEKRYQNGTELAEALKQVYKFDTIYKRYRRNCIVTAAGLAVAYVASGLLISSGISMVKRERQNWYYQTVAQADQKIKDGEFDQAETYIMEAMQKQPEKIEAYEREVLRLYESRQYEACVAYGRDTVNSPNYYIQTDTDRETLGDILYIMGNAYYELDDYNNALKSFELALDYNTGNSAYYCDYGIVLAKTGNLAKADQILADSEQLGLAKDSVYLLQGEIAYAGGQMDEAVELLKRAANVTDSQKMKIRAVLLCAKAYEGLGETSLDAETAFLEEWNSRLGDMQLEEKLADLYARQEQDEKALEIFQDMKAKGYATYQNSENMAILYQRMDQPEEARTLLLQMGEDYPERYEAWKRLAYLEADIQQHKENKKRDYSQMKAYYDKAVELYQKQEHSDGEMQQLEAMMKELQDGKWFQ